MGSVGVSAGSPQVAHAVDTAMAISTTTAAFGPVSVGSSGSITVTLTNGGAVPFGPINIFGGAPPTAEFGASQNCQGVTLSAGGTCSITYTFTPSGAGAFNDTSSFTISPTASQSDGEDFSVALSGTGVNPITAAPVSHDFGPTPVGSASAPRQTVITNTGSVPFGPINIFGGAPPTAEFGASQNCQGVTLPAGGTCSINYTFTPSGAGTFNDTSSFTISPTANQQDGTDFSVALAGTGAAPITAAPLSHDFGERTVGVAAGPLTTVITNTGSVPFGPINIFGGAPPTAEFGASQNCQGVTLPAGGTCSINYTFTPSGAGVFNDTSSFTISDTQSQSDGVDFSVTLTGCGAPCPVPTSSTTTTTAATTTTLLGSGGPSATTTTQVSGRGLPSTGSSTPVVAWAAFALAGGAALVLTTRRRARS
ncbi:MAG: choice-of-anchor D domain-containing protein [Actinomycetota bacterium]|nr:choice-of-anchor D domain-containing protein [Actinomycetota bacterium]